MTEGNASEHFRYSLKHLFIIVSVFALMIPAILAIDGCAISLNETSLIRVGMTKEQVLSRIGHPPHVANRGEWVYSIWGSPADDFVVEFDKNDVVTYAGF